MTTFPAHTAPTPHLREVSRPPRLAALLNPAAMTASIWRHRALLGQFAARSIAERTRGSYLGLAWTLLHPLLMLGVYTFVFAVVWQARWGDIGSTGSESKTTFAVTIFAGLLLFEVFGASVGPSPTTIVHNANYVKRVVFPLEVLPLAGVTTALLLSFVSVLVLLVGKGATGSVLLGGADARVSSTLHFFPLVLPALIALAAGVSLFLSALGVFLRDIRPIVQGMLLQVLFFMTPIFYPVERIPDWLRPILAANPLAVIVESGRRTLVMGEQPDWTALGIVTLVAFVVLQLGYAFFMKSKRGFADVL